MEQPAANVRMAAASGMQQKKDVRMHAKDFFRDAEDGHRVAKDRRVAAKEFPRHERKLRILATSSCMHANFPRRVGKFPNKDAGAFLQEDSSTPMLRKIHFRHPFFCRNVPWKKNRDDLSFRRLDPPQELHTFAAFVLRQRTSVHNPAAD